MDPIGQNRAAYHSALDDLSGDPMTELYALEASSCDAGKESAFHDVDTATAQKSIHEHEANVAADRAEAEAKKSGFFSSIESVASTTAMVAGSVAAIAASGGSASILVAATAGALLSGSSMVAQKLGASGGLVEGLAIGGAGASLVSGGMTFAAAEGVTCFGSLGATSTAMGSLAQGAGTVGAAASLTGAGASVGEKYHLKQSTDAQGDAMIANAAADTADEARADALGDAQRAQRAEGNLQKTTTKIEDIEQETRDAIIQHIGTRA